MSKCLCVLLALVLLAVAQNEPDRQDLLIIDPFNPDTSSLVIIIDNTQLPQTQFASTQDAGILGGERDLSLTAETGPDGRILTTGVSAGQWNTATPNSASGFALMQYDGPDNSIDLATSGLGGIDMTANSADGFRLQVVTDIATVYVFDVYDTAGGSSTFEIEIPGDSVSRDYFLFFSDFNGNCDFSTVGAIEILIEAFDNVDTLVDFFALSGVPSAPVPSPSPQPDGETWYTFDDDDNGVSPCGDEEPRRTYFLSDDNVIYYYFYGQPDDDDGQYERLSGSGAASLTVSALLLVFALVL